MPALDVNGLTDTKTKALGSKQTKNYVALNGNEYKSEAEFVKIERKGE